MARREITVFRYDAERLLAGKGLGAELVPPTIELPFEFVGPFRWNVVRRRKVTESGTGRTLDLSSGGILFDAGRPLTPGMGVEISIAWPALLNDVAPMQLRWGRHYSRPRSCAA